MLKEENKFFHDFLISKGHEFHYSKDEFFTIDYSRLDDYIEMAKEYISI